MNTIKLKDSQSPKSLAYRPYWMITRFTIQRFLKRNAPVFEALSRNATPFGANVLPL